MLVYGILVVVSSAPMFALIAYILYFTLLNIVIQIDALMKLPVVEENNIAIAETDIRNTVNSLFAALRIQDASNRPRLKQYCTLHNFFVSLTLTDCKSLKEIARLTRVTNIDNNTQRFIAHINEALNEYDKTYEANDNNIYIEKLVNLFINKLKYLKDIIWSSNILDKNKNITEEKYKTRNESNKHSLSYAGDQTKVFKPYFRRIYQGICTNISTFPFVAGIKVFKKFHCAGSIIDTDLVITASSCLRHLISNNQVVQDPEYLSVQVGSETPEGGRNIAVLRVYFHPDYNPQFLSNNLAILRLTITIEGSRRIQFDEMPWAMPINVGKITVVGWGAKDRKDVIFNILRNKLSYAELDLYPLWDCQSYYSKKMVTTKNFCAGFYSEGSGACNRDVGGPAVVNNVLMGVISFGSQICGAPVAPTVFTKLGFYRDWIQNVMGQSISYRNVTPTRARMKAFTPIHGYKGQFKIKPIFRRVQSEKYHDLLPIILKNAKNNKFFDDSSFGDTT